MDVLSLLKSKNRALKRFLNFTHLFVEESKKTGDLSQLSTLIEKRDAAIRAFGLYDQKINETLTRKRQNNLSLEERALLKKTLEDKNEIIKKIFDVDTQITLLIEAEMKSLSLEITFAQKGKEILQKFKSTWMTERGDGLDETL
jgi:hypothetical protein